MICEEEALMEYPFGSHRRKQNNCSNLALIEKKMK